MADRDAGPDLGVGPVEQAKAWADENKRTDTRFAAEGINGPMIRQYASALEDGNPTYWNEAFAERTWGGVCSPPGMLTTWKLPLLWVPEAGHQSQQLLSSQIPLPAEMNTVINVETEMSYHRPIRVGTRLNWTERVVDVSDEKETRLGRGHFLTTETEYRDQRGTVVCEYTGTLYRYEPADTDSGSVSNDEPDVNERRDVELTESTAGERDRYDSLSVHDISTGDTVPSVTYPVPYRKIIYSVAATRDFYPGHHDPSFAREQGNSTIFLNTIAFQGLVDRLVTDWLGPAWRISQRTISMQGSVEAGDHLELRGTVIDVENDGTSAAVTVDCGVFVGDATVCPGTVTAERQLVDPLDQQR